MADPFSDLSFDTLDLPDFEIPTASFSDNPDIPESPVQKFRKENQDAAFHAAKKRVENKREILSQLGEEVPAEGESGIQRFFDIIDTGGQLVRGGIASLTGTPGYRNKGIFEGALKGDAEDLTVGSILRRNRILQGNDWGSAIGRGGASFLGDVFSDPLTYTGIGALGKGAAAGKQLSSKAIASIGKLPTELFDDVVKKAQTSLFDDFTAKGLDKALPDELIELRKAEIPGKAVKQANKTFEKLQSYQKWQKDVRGLDSLIDGQTGKAALKPIEDLGEQLTRELGLNTTSDLDKIFAKPALRIINPVSGNVSDIPFVTDATEKLFDKLGGAFYQVNRAVGKTVGKTADKIVDKEIPFLSSGVDKAQKAGRALAAAPKLVSRRLQHLGSVQGDQFTRENQRAIFQARSRVGNEAEVLAKRWGFNPEQLTAISSTLESELKAIKDVGGRVKTSVLQEPNHIVEQAFQRAVGRATAAHPDKAPQIEEAINFFRQDFQRMATEATDQGFLEGVINGYVPLNHGVDYVDDIADPKTRAIASQRTNEFAKNVKEGKQNFTFERAMFENIEQAQLAGRKVDTNILNLWANRKIAQEKMLASKDYMERMGYEYALPASLKAELDLKLASHNDKQARDVLELFKRRGHSVDTEVLLNPANAKNHYTNKAAQLFPDDLAKQKEFVAANVPIVDEYGRALNPDEYQNLKALKESGELSKRDAGRIKQLKLKFDPFEEQKVNQLWEGGFFQYPRNKSGELLGTDQFDAITARVQEFEQATGMSISNTKMPQLKAAFREAGLTGEANFVEAVREYRKLGAAGITRELVEENRNLFSAARGVRFGRAGESETTRAGATYLPQKFRSFTKKLDPETQKWAEGLLPQPIADVIQESFDTKSTYQRIAKAMEGKPGGEAIAGIAKGYLGWVKNLKVASTVFWPSYHMRNLVSGQIQGLGAASFGEQFNPLRLLDTHLISNGAKDLVLNNGTVIPNKVYKTMLGQFGIQTDKNFALDVLEHSADALSHLTEPGKLSGIKKYGTAGIEKVKGLSHYVEQYGREHLFINQLKRGLDPASAAQNVNKFLLDYGTGKTPFEKNVLNNIIFFYSFARGEASNTLVKMMSRPGALSTQLHVVDGVAELVRDPNAIPPPPDVEKAMQSTRSKESLSRFIGRTDEGYVKALTGVGMPVEELSRFVNFQVPEKLTIGSLTQATMDSAGRGMYQLASSINPVLKEPLQMLAGKNFFFDKPITDKNIRRYQGVAPLLEKIVPQKFEKITGDTFEGVDTATMNLLGATPNGDGTYTADPYKLSLALMIVPGLGRVQNTSNFMSKDNISFPEKMARLFSGVRTQELDPEKARIFDEDKKLSNLLERKGLPTSKKQLRQRQALLAEQGDDESDF